VVYLVFVCAVVKLCSRKLQSTRQLWWYILISVCAEDVGLCCSVLQCVAVIYIVLQCVAVLLHAEDISADCDAASLEKLLTNQYTTTTTIYDDYRADF